MRRTREGLGVYNATIAGCDRLCELRAGNLGTVYANLREEDASDGRGGGWNDGRTSGGRDEREEGSNANEGEGLYRYVPAAVVCNIMITLPACAWLPSSLSLALPLVSLLRVHQAATLFQRPCCREI